MMWRTLVDIYYNFWNPNRRTWCLWAFVALAALCSLNAALGMYEYGLGLFTFFFSMFLWATILPCAIFLIDVHRGQVTRKPRWIDVGTEPKK